LKEEKILINLKKNVGNIVLIDVKDMGRLQMSKIKIAKWRFLEILVLDY
jgi:hypothetical protein